jgi:hypothetical protein
MSAANNKSKNGTPGGSPRRTRGFILTRSAKRTKGTPGGRAAQKGPDEPELEALDWRPTEQVMRILERLDPFRQEEAAAA